MTDQPGSLRQAIAAAVDQAIEEDNLDNLTDFADRLTSAVLTAVTEHLDIGEEQAWCKYCRRAWNSPAHRCESDGEQRVQEIAQLRDRWLTEGPPPLGAPLARWWDKRLVELNAVLNGEQSGAHSYLSTGCYHGDHAYCQSMTGLNGAKRPGVCKFCQAACQCGCHSEAGQPGPAATQATEPGSWLLAGTRDLPEPSDPTECTGEEGFCPEHGFHRHSLKEPGPA